MKEKIKYIIGKIRLFFKSGHRAAVAAFMCLLVLPSLLYPALRGAVDVELNENRNLTAFGAGGNFGTNFEAYYNDRMPFRSNLIAWYKAIFGRFIRSASDGIAELIPEAEIPVVESDVIYGKDGWLFFAGENSLDYYRGTNIMPDADMAVYTDILIRADEYFSAMGKKFVYITLPNKENVYPEKMPTAYKVETEKKRAETFVEYVNKNSGVRIVHPKDELIAAKSQYQPYYKYDTHWNELGAYVGYSQILKKLHMPPPPILDALQITPLPKSGGDLAGFVGITESCNDDLSYNIGYKPDVVITDTEVLGAGSVLKYTSTAEENRKVVVIGDSFRERLVPWFTKDFHTVYSIHRGALDIETILQAVNEADLVIYDTVECYDYSAIIFINRFIVQ
jgi:hypothetical protein